MLNAEKNMNSIINLCKNRGFVFQGSEIYGGLANTWDYGPLGSLMKNNIKKMWIKKFIQENHMNVMIDSSIFMNSETWRASGHLDNFSDMLTDCKNCKMRFRADKLLEENNVEYKMSNISDYLSGVKCPNCGESNFTKARNFNLMFKTYQGVTEDSLNQIFLRPETAQGIFVNFSNVLRCTRKKIPFGIGQIGKSFRNEITPGNFLFRTREFEQMELEFFCKEGTDDEWFKYWKSFCFSWLENLGLKSSNIRFRDHDKEELSHYSKETSDIEFLFPFGWGELCGIANRTRYDLTQHQKFSGKSLEYFDSDTEEKYIPYVIEPSIGADRLFLSIICDAYDEEKLENGETRTILRLSKDISPFCCCVLPLSKTLNDEAMKIYDTLSKKLSVDFDSAGSIGKRYRRQDEIGTPFCITYDFESKDDSKVTVRFRDSMKQERVDISNLLDVLK